MHRRGSKADLSCAQARSDRSLEGSYGMPLAILGDIYFLIMGATIVL